MILAYEEIAGAIVVVLAAISAVKLVLELIEKIKSAKKPHDQHIAQVTEHEQKLLHDYVELEEHKRRLDCHDEELESMEKHLREVIMQNRILIRATNQLLEHEITGNDVAALQVERGIMERYLSGDLYELEVVHGQAG